MDSNEKLNDIRMDQSACIENIDDSENLKC